MTPLIWIGIVLCLVQSAMFSGLNLAFFSVTRLRLEIQAEAGHTDRAKKVLKMRENSNFLLTTILWGNVGINVLLTLLSDSVMTGILSFTFSTVVITILGEIVPQAYFSRHALRMAALLTPVLKFYQVLLYPVAKPCALLLDWWLGRESIQYFSEQNIQLFLKKHIKDASSDIEYVEGTGAINFLNLDDVKIDQEGENIHPRSVISLPCTDGRVIFPSYRPAVEDTFIQRINESGKKWIIFTDGENEPKLALDADGFIRSDVLSGLNKGIEAFCHLPIVFFDRHTDLGKVLVSIRNELDANADGPIDKDVVIFWSDDHKRIITGADLLGRLAKGL